MNKKKVMIIFGTRPEAIKLAPIIYQFKNLDSKINIIICITGQHREMLQQVLDIFNIIPHYNMNIMKNGQDLFDISIQTLHKLKKILKRERPDLVLVQGDTTTAFIGGLASFYERIPIAHVESGLRTYNKYSPFPEEKNRHLLSVIADFHFAPTPWARSNLFKEGIAKDKIWVTGNTVIDALLIISKRHQSTKNRRRWITYFRNKWNINLNDHKRLILVTGHRRENFGIGFKNICEALREIAELRDDVTIIYPVHLNPNVRKPVNSILSKKYNIHLIDPLEYEAFTFLMDSSYLVLTDSGGIQEEAPALGKPVLVMRDTTERPEGIKAGTVKLVGTDKDTIVTNTINLLDNNKMYRKMATAVNPYGDGKASIRIVKIICDAFNLTETSHLLSERTQGILKNIIPRGSRSSVS